MFATRSLFIYKSFSILLFAGILTAGAWAQSGAASAPAGAIEGRVLDASGKPVKGAEIVVQLDAGLERSADPKEKKPAVKIAKGETDKDGIYRIEPVAVGRIRVAARKDDPKDHSFTFARGTAGPVYEVVARKITKIDDIKIRRP